MTRFGVSIFLIASLWAAQAQAGMIGINVLLNTEVSDEILVDLGSHGKVLDVLAEINAVTMKAQDSELASIQALPYVAAANEDVERFLAANEPLPVPDFVDGTNAWNLDAINVTDSGGGRTVAYTGEGVYVAVPDTGLPYNWREYFPEERIDTLHARGFSGGGGEKGSVSAQPVTWERDTHGHGTLVTSVILGFNYSGPEESFSTFNGVAPRATVIPLKVLKNNGSAWCSVVTQSLLYLSGLKASGALGNAPLVVNLSLGGPESDAVQQAAIDYAIAAGVIIVAGAGNQGESGMIYPAAYPPIISAGNAGWVSQFEFPGSEPSLTWILSDVPEGDSLQYFVDPSSSRELSSQDLDVVAPGDAVPGAITHNGQVDYTFFWGSSAAAPHAAGVAALLLEKDPLLTQAQIEEILESTALLLPQGCDEVTFPALGPGNPATWGDADNVFFFDTTVCWDADATGHGLLQADAALALP